MINCIYKFGFWLNQDFFLSLNPDIDLKRHYPNTGSGKSLIWNAPIQPTNNKSFPGFDPPNKTMPTPSIETSIASLSNYLA